MKYFGKLYIFNEKKENVEFFFEDNNQWYDFYAEFIKQIKLQKNETQFSEKYEYDVIVETNIDESYSFIENELYDEINKYFSDFVLEISEKK